MEEVYLKEKLRNLISLRTNLFAVLIVLTGGLFGLFFTSLTTIKFYVLLAIGIYFGWVFLTNLLSINKQIEELIERLKD